MISNTENQNLLYKVTGDKIYPENGINIFNIQINGDKCWFH